MKSKNKNRICAWLGEQKSKIEKEKYYNISTPAARFAKYYNIFHLYTYAKYYNIYAYINENRK